MKISANQIFNSCNWINPNLLVFELYSEVLNKSFPVELHFNSNTVEKNIRKETIKSIIEFQNLNNKDIEEILSKVWDFVKKYKSENELDFLGIKNKNDVISKSEIVGVGFINEDDLNHSFFHIFLKTEWDVEHGITVSFFDGKLDDIE